VSLFVDAAITPQRRPATVIGQPIDERIPTPSASWAIAPVSPMKLATRTGPPGRPNLAGDAGTNK
jgi:hypothetical protein